MSTGRALKSEARGLEPLAERAKLPSATKKLIIILTLCYWIFGAAGNVSHVVGKCCPPGYVIMEYSSCSFARGDHPQIYKFQHQVGDMFSSPCPEREEVNVAHLEDLVEPTFRADIACIDMMYDEDEDTSEPILFRCASNESSEDAVGTGSFAVPKLPTLRMCCEMYQVYDTEKRDCVFKKDGPNVPTNFQFLKESLEFVSVIRSAPPCRSAILDYVVNGTRDIRVLYDGSLEVVLTTKDGPKTIIADANSTCLDPGTSGEPALIVIRACIEEGFCDKNPCVSKCCAEDLAWIDNECSKIPPGVPAGYFHDMLHNVSVRQGVETEANTLQTSDYGMLIGKTCEKTHVPDQSNRWHITPMGKIDVAKDRIYGHDEYCVEMFFGDPSREDGIYPLLCAEDSDS